MPLEPRQLAPAVPEDLSRLSMLLLQPSPMLRPTGFAILDQLGAAPSARTRDLLDDFGRVLGECDVLLVTEVYPAGEAPIAGADGRAICRAVRSRGVVEPVFVERVDDLADSLRAVLHDGDVVLTMGAGNLGAVALELKSRFAAGAAA